MKIYMNVVATLFFVTVFSISLMSQEKKYFDSPFGLGVGFTPGWIFPKLNPLNEKLSSLETGIPALGENGLFTTGGAGFVYIGLVPGLRIGGMGFSGTTSETSSRHSSGYTYEAEYIIGGGGLTVEYTLPFVKDFGISLGAALGGGGIEIDLYKNKGGADWNTIGKSDSAGYHYKFMNNYWYLSPTLNFDIPFYRFLNLRIGGGYQLSFAEKWEVDNEQPLENVPSGLNGKTFFVQIGIFAGFFSF